MCEKKENNMIPEEKLEKVSGGIWYDSGARDSSDVPGSFEMPIVLDTDEKVRSFVDRAMQYSFVIRVRDRSRSVDGKDYAQVLSLDRSSFVNVYAECSMSDPFGQIAMGYAVY